MFANTVMSLMFAGILLCANMSGDGAKVLFRSGFECFDEVGFPRTVILLVNNQHPDLLHFTF